MPLEALLIGGRYDGARLPASSRRNFVFVGGDEKRPRIFAMPAKGRWMYRSLGQADRCLEEKSWDFNAHAWASAETVSVEIFLCAEHDYRLCACGAFVERSEWQAHEVCSTVAA